MLEVGIIFHAGPSVACQNACKIVMETTAIGDRTFRQDGADMLCRGEEEPGRKYSGGRGDERARASI